MKPAWIALALVVLLCAAFCLTQLSEVDHYWHLLAGRQILEEGQVPRVDDFTYTSSGRVWIDLHWLFQVMLALVDGLASWRGVEAAKIALIVGGFVLAGLAALRRAPPLVVAPLGLLAVLAAQERFALRPEAASFLLLGGVLLVLEAGRRRPRLLFILPPMIALWANLHALFAVGLAAIGLAVAGELIDRWNARRRGDAGAVVYARSLYVAAALSIPASLLTPYGLAAWKLPRRLLLERIATGNIYGRSIAEFQAPFSGFGVTVAIVAFALLAAVVVIAAIAARADLRPADLLILAAFLGLALLARRNLPLFAIAALPAGAAALDGAIRRVRRSIGRWGGEGRPGLAANLVTGAIMAVTLVALHGVVSNRFFERDGTQRYFGSGPAPGFYPREAANFIDRHAIDGEVLNDMTMGGYLAWSWYPRRRIFIDGRLELHDPALYKDYLELQQSPERFAALARRYDIGAVLWSHRHSLDAIPLMRYLTRSPQWRIVFVDLAAVVFVRRPDGGEWPGWMPAIDPGGAETVDAILAQDRAGSAASVDPLPRWLRRLVPRRDVPVAIVSAALSLSVIGELPAAERLLADAIARSPDNPVLHYDRGLVLERAGRYPEARADLEKSTRLDPAFVPAWAALGLLRLRNGDETGALREWGIAERHGELPFGALQARGALRARRGDLDDAIQDYRALLRRDPYRIGARAELALLYHHRGFVDLAQQEIRRALGDAPGACPPRAAAGRIRLAEGDAAGAEAQFRRVVGDHPTCHEASLGLASLLAAQGRDTAAIGVLTGALGAGLDPASLSAEPGLRMLMSRPDVRRTLDEAARTARETQRR